MSQAPRASSRTQPFLTAARGEPLLRGTSKMEPASCCYFKHSLQRSQRQLYSLNTHEQELLQVSFGAFARWHPVPEEQAGGSSRAGRQHRFLLPAARSPTAAQHLPSPLREAGGCRVAKSSPGPSTNVPRHPRRPGRRCRGNKGTSNRQESTTAPKKTRSFKTLLNNGAASLLLKSASAFCYYDN